MKKSSRKRLLISSVAMLLVAMLALGTATYAWFTTSSTTTASGINVKTAAKSVLTVSSMHKTWTNALDYEFSNQAIKPASSADGRNWYYADANNQTTWQASTGNKITDPSATAAQQYLFYDMLNVKNEGTVKLNNVTIAATISETKTNSTSYLRVALVPAKSVSGADLVEVTDDNKTTAVVESASSFLTHIYGGSGAATPVDHVGANKAATTGAITAAASNSAGGTTINEVIPSLSANEAKYYMLFVWFEGQDPDCKDANAGNAMPSISFTITGTPDAA